MRKLSLDFLPCRNIAPASRNGPLATPSGVRCFPALAHRAGWAVLRRAAVCLVAAALLLPRASSAQETQTNSAPQVFARALTQLVAILEAPTNQAPRTFTTTL